VQTNTRRRNDKRNILSMRMGESIAESGGKRYKGKIKKEK
jgi:hypothetical protein